VSPPSGYGQDPRRFFDSIMAWLGDFADEESPRDPRHVTASMVPDLPPGCDGCRDTFFLLLDSLATQEQAYQRLRAAEQREAQQVAVIHALAPGEVLVAAGAAASLIIAADAIL